MKIIQQDIISQANQEHINNLQNDYDALGNILSRDGIEIEALTTAAMKFDIAVPSWGTGTGGTRFARFLGEGEPRTILEKLADC